MPDALTGHGGGGNCANGMAVRTWFKFASASPQRIMHLPEDEIVRLVHPDLDRGFVEVSLVQSCTTCGGHRGAGISASRSCGDQPPKNTERPPMQ